MKKILIVVDYQKDFVSGALGFDGAQLLDGRIAEKIKAYRSEGQTVAFTFDTHGEDYLSTQEGRRLPVPHCISGTDGWELYGTVASLREKDDPVFCKKTFGSMELADYLRDCAFDSVELVGLVSNICVLSNAILAKAALPEAEIIVDADCTMSFDPVIHEKTLDVLESVQVTVPNRK